MISKIDYALTFSNGKSLSQCLELEAGSTLITGANGKGKSLNFEMAAFALFGNKALRGVAGDYKKMKVEVDVTINGEQYTLKRTKSKSEVFHKGEPVASGTKPVNQWVVRTLGYGFDVFRIAHWCAQGDIQALASMRPTERKAMIDSVAGLTQMDGLATSMGAEIRELKAVIDTHKSTLTVPVAPVAPETPKADLETALAGYKGKLETFLTASAVAQPVAPTTPVKPEEPVLPSEPEAIAPTLKAPVAPEIPAGVPSSVSQLGTVDQALQQKLDSAGRVEQKALRLEALYKPCEPSSEWPERQPLVLAWEAYERHLRLADLKAHNTIECPSCSHQFHLSGEIDKLEQTELREEAPTLTVKDWDAIAEQISNNEQFAKVKAELDALEITVIRDALHQIRVTKTEVLQFDKANKEYKEHVSRVAQVNQGQKANWDRTVAQLNAGYENQMKAFNSQMAHFDKLKSDYLAAEQTYQDAQAKRNAIVEEFPNNTEQVLRQVISQLESSMLEWNNFEQLQTQYDTLLAKYNKSLEGVAAEEEKLAELTRARDALKVVKSKVQSHLLPSLNKVASMLMGEMTGGEFQMVEVGQDFEVTVDGQPLRTLSGSGKDLANLTLRIGLGRILTHRVLPVMMLDEIDSAMDDTRASFTWQCIQRITPHIGQVLQASHKELSAETRVSV